MQPWVWIVIALLVIAAGAAVVGMTQQRRQARLRDTFGPEYQRTVEARGSRREAERELSGRFERRQKLDIRPLDEEQRERYAAEWRNVQARFVDVPNDAVGEADTLVSAVMRERGYPIADFDQRASDLSVDHGGVIENYRRAHDISRRSSLGQASTEDLRQAMVCYRSLFDELLGAGNRDASRAG
jgi:hypothetical protein